VLSLAYPDSIAGLPELLDGIAGVLTSEGVTAAHIVGGSYSGLVAQHFAVRHPQRVASLLLSNTAAPNTSVEAKFRRFTRTVAWLPEPLLRLTMRAAIPLFLRRNSPEHRFWRAYFTAALARFSRPGFINRLRIYAEMNTQTAIRQWTAVSWRGPTLIVEAERDAFTTTSGGAALRAHFPQARHVLLPGRGHSAALDASELYLHHYQEFLCTCTSPTAG
jgi:pimeloyl-ACP methyl ester carboxylesterase